MVRIRMKPRYPLIALTFVTAVGCAAHVDDFEPESEPEEVADTQQPIFGGTGQENRGLPAIGKLLLNGNDACTATLISSRVILTAAHCFGFDLTRSGMGSATQAPSFPATNSPYQFQIIPAAPAQPQTRWVRRYVLASAAYGAADIAVAELESEVSWSYAAPIGVARNEPADGAAVTQWGYGCNAGMVVWNGMDHVWTNTSGGGVKRMASTTWNATNNTTNTPTGCAGDSGGPIIDNGTGNIVGVHSSGGGPGAGLDGTGDVVSFRRFISQANAIYGKRQVCDDCREVALRTWNGRNYLKAIDGGLGDVVADATQIGSWERFRLVPFIDGFSPWHAIQTTSGRWVSAVNGGGGKVVSGTNYVNVNETFIVGSRAGGNTFGTRRTPRNWIVAEGAGGGAVNANRSSAGDWETFFVVPL